MKDYNCHNAAGEVQTMTTYAMVAGAKRPVKVGQRSYCGDFVEKCAGVLRLCNLWWLGDWWIFCNFAVYEVLEISFCECAGADGRYGLRRQAPVERAG